MQVARRGGAASLSKHRIMQSSVVADQEIRMVKDVKGFRAELQTEPVRKPEIPEDRNIRLPKAWADERISTKISNTA